MSYQIAIFIDDGSGEMGTMGRKRYVRISVGVPHRCQLATLAPNGSVQINDSSFHLQKAYALAIAIAKLPKAFQKMPSLQIGQPHNN